MDKNNRGSIVKKFIAAFILLFFIVLVLPILVDQAVYLFSDGMIPKNDSIIVFKDLDKKYEAIGKLVENLKKLIKFM